MPARGGARGFALAVVLSVAALLACGRARHEPSPSAGPSVAHATVVAAPPGLLLRGALRRPAEVWARLRSLAGGRALLAPSSLPLAVTTALGLSPLLAGLIDETAPIVIAVVQAGPSEVAPLVGIRLTSGAEWIVALANGSDARFSAMEEPDHGVTLLVRKTTGPGSFLAVSGDYLLVSPSRESLRLAGAYVARTLAPSLADGAVLELVAPGAALAGPVSTALRASVAELAEQWRVADLTGRAQHGGRAPDYADPEAVIAAIGRRLDGVLAVVGTSSEVHCTATLLDEAPLLRAELVAERPGAARDLIRDSLTSDVRGLLSLPSWTQAAFLFRRAPSSAAAAPPVVEPLRSLVGDRLSKKDEALLEGWAADATLGLGAAVAVGWFGSPAVGLGAFAVGPEGDGAALRRAASRLPDLLRVRALAAPLEASFGQLDVTRAESVSPQLGPTVHVRARRTGRSTQRSAGELEVAAASAGGRAAVVVSKAAAEGPLADLLLGRAPMLGTDAVVARAVVRASDRAALAVVLRAQDVAGQVGWSVLTMGSDRRVAWAELGVEPVALGVLLSGWIGP